MGEELGDAVFCHPMELHEAAIKQVTTAEELYLLLLDAPNPGMWNAFEQNVEKNLMEGPGYCSESYRLQILSCSLPAVTTTLTTTTKTTATKTTTTTTTTTNNTSHNNTSHNNTSHNNPNHNNTNTNSMVPSSAVKSNGDPSENGDSDRALQAHTAEVIVLG